MIPQPDGTKLLDVQHVSRMFNICGSIGGSRLVAVNDVSFSLESVRPEDLHAGRGERKRQDDAVPHAVE